MEATSELRLIVAVSFDAAIKIDGEEGGGGGWREFATGATVKPLCLLKSW